MGASDAGRVGRPRIRRRLRVIAIGLVVLPTLAFAVLVRAFLDADEQSKLRELQDRRDRVQGQAEDLAGRLGSLRDLFPARRREHFALRDAADALSLSQPIDVDGYCGDWRATGLFDSQPCVASAVMFDRGELLAKEEAAYDRKDFSFSLLTGERDAYLFLFLRVVDDDLMLERRRLSDRDHLRLVVSVPRGGEVSVPARFATMLEPGAAGEVTTYQVDAGWAQEVGARQRLAWGGYQLPAWRRPYGRWRRTPEGYDIELRLPLRSLGPGWQDVELGLAVVDVDRDVGNGGALRRNAMWALPQHEGAFALEAPGARRFRATWPDLALNLRKRRVAVFDARRRELFSSFESTQLLAPELRAAVPVLLEQLRRGSTASVASRARGAGALAAARVTSPNGGVLGFVVEEDPGAVPPLRVLTIVRESPVTAAFLGGALLLLILLLSYTRRLSRRILALVDDVGADRGADDEIGELSRRLSDLVERVQADRDYLERLPAILGHETLGPLGVVKMYLADLEARDDAPPEGRHLAARRALHSIEELIEDLREATSLEEALSRGERIEIDLVDFVRDCTSAYGEANGAALQVTLPENPHPSVVIEGRVEQLLDKLLDNAVEFSDGAPVRVALTCSGSEATIRVENSGSRLPVGAAADSLFDPMWSQRKRTSERHLGMGLYVARIIAEHHGGEIRAWNADADRVVFEVRLRQPRSRPDAR